MLHRPLQIETLKSVHKIGVQYTLILIQTVEQKKQELNDYANQISNLNREKEELSQRAEYLTQSLQQREQELKDLVNQLEERNRLYEDVSAQLSQKQEELQDYSLKLEMIQKEKTELLRENENLKNEINQKNSLIEKLSKEKGELFITLIKLKNSFYWKFFGKPISRMQKLFWK